MAVAATAFVGMAMAPAGAQSASGPGNALKISPVRTDVTIKPGESRTIVLSRRSDGEGQEQDSAAAMRFTRFFNNTPMAIASVNGVGRILKTNAPFWKKEHLAAGARTGDWVGAKQQDDAFARRWQPAVDLVAGRATAPVVQLATPVARR